MFIARLVSVYLSIASFTQVIGAEIRAEHWAFQPVTASSPPAIRNVSWPSTPIDRFILAKLESAGRAPVAAANLRTLLRRVTYDLTGLPPTPEETHAFLADPSPEAFTRLLDRLLASPAYGERWGRHWLDLVRYADTAGETADYPVPEAYRYRNYVIQSLNQDKPYDAFIREQLAGDILAQQGLRSGTIDRDRYSELITATGFIAIARRFGFDTEKYEHLTIQDTIDTMGQVVQGLTLGCARCHDHKYDPVSIKDYYALYGFFASTRYAFAGSERLPQTRAMTPLVGPGEAAEQWTDWRQQVRDLAAQIKAIKPDYKLPFDLAIRRPLTDLDGDFELQAPPSGGSLGLPANPWQFTGKVGVRTSAQSPLTHVYPAGHCGAELSSDPSDCSLGRGLVPSLGGDGCPGIHFSVDFCVLAGLNTTGVYRIYLGPKNGTPAVEFLISQRDLSVRKGNNTEQLRELEPGKWYHLRTILDTRSRTFEGTIGSSEDWHSWKAKECSSTWDGTIDYLGIDAHSTSSSEVRPGLKVDNFAISLEPLPPIPDATQPDTNVASDSSNEQQKKDALAELEKRMVTLANARPYDQTYGVWEGTPQDAHVQIRGEPVQRGELAPRRFLKVLGGNQLKQGTVGSGRLELAGWLTHVDNPLTARVMVNRIWQYHFGHGLVRTENDFGTRGEPPSHRKLLDYLAARFIDSDWSIKAMHRLIMASQTYRLAMDDRLQTIQVDPTNRLLGRFSRRRVSAECFRDALLMLGGDLDRSMGGPHPFPAVTKTRFSQHGPFRASYETNRRSIYLMTQRLQRHPFLALFDGADTNASTPKRSQSIVPTQALFILNDAFVHRQSEGFARRLLSLQTDDRTRIVTAFEMALTRLPEENEIRSTLDFLAEYRDQWTPHSARGAEIDLEAWAGVARTLFARNEFSYLD